MSMRTLGKISDEANAGLNAMEEIPCDPTSCDPSVNVFCRPCCVSMALTNIKFLISDEIHEAEERDGISDENFRKMIQEAAPDLAAQRKFAEEFQVSVPTVTRWANGVSCPHPYMRHSIKDFVEKRKNKR